MYVGREGAAQLYSNILEGHELQFELLTDRTIVPAVLGKSSGGLALEFALADVANICADHETEQMLGIDTLSANPARKQRRETHDCRTEGLRTLWH